MFPLVVRAGGGSARDSLSVLDQLLAGAGPEGVTYERAVALLGVTDVALIDDVVDALAAADRGAVFEAVDRLVEAGHDPRRFAADLLQRLRDLTLLQAMPEAAERGLVEAADDETARMVEQAAKLGPATLTRYGEIVHTGLTEMRGATAPRLLLELLCARMLLPAATVAEPGLLERLERLERRNAIAPAPLPHGGSGADDGPSGGPTDAPTDGRRSFRRASDRPADAGAGGASQPGPADGGTGGSVEPATAGSGTAGSVESGSVAAATGGSADPGPSGAGRSRRNRGSADVDPAEPDRPSRAGPPEAAERAVPVDPPPVGPRRLMRRRGPPEATRPPATPRSSRPPITTRAPPGARTPTPPPTPPPRRHPQRSRPSPPPSTRRRCAGRGPRSWPPPRSGRSARPPCW